MWNPFSIRSNEARRLELRIVELEDDLTKAIRLIERIDARGRGRASRESAPADSRPADVGAVPGDRNTGQPVLSMGNGEAPTFTKEQLRQFARNRGLGT